MFKKEWFGNIIFVLFILTQVLDGIFTYMGVMRFGLDIEWNFLMSTMISVWGGYGLLAAKIFASILGATLYFTNRFFADCALIGLTGFYYKAALEPWIVILFYKCA